MKTTIGRSAIFFVFSLLLLTGCQGDSQESPSPVSPEDIMASRLAESSGPVDIEGNVVPASVVNLSFAIPGAVQEVFVSEGESVAEGQLLATNGDRRQAEAALAASELELLSAQQDLQALHENQAALLTEAFLTLVSARQDVRNAEQLLEQLTGEVLDNEIAAAEAQLILAADGLEAAEDDFAEVEDDDEDDPTRARLQLALAEARRTQDEVLLLLDDLQGEGYTFRLQQAEDMLQAARDHLALAEERYDELSVDLDPDRLALAESRLAAAEATLDAAEAGLAQNELRAPMAGTVVGFAIKAGEQVAAGQPVGQVADLSAWIVETLDLTEFDVVSIDPDQSVLVTADALPDITMTGTILSVANVPRDVRGDVTYVARVRLDTTDPRLRWGMTVLVEFQ